MHDARALFTLAHRAARLAGPDTWLDRDICLALRYLAGTMFMDWLAVLPDGRLSSADGSNCALPDPFTNSIDAVEKLRRCLLPGSRLSVRSIGGGMGQFECHVEHGFGPNQAGNTAVAGSEPLARLAALLQSYAGSVRIWPDPAGEQAVLRFALVDK